MAVEIVTRKEVSTLVSWNVTPKTGRTIESESFLVYGCKWNLKFNSSNDNRDLKWSIRLHNFNNTNPSLFPLTVYIRCEGKDLSQQTNMISSQSTEIWSGWYSDYLNICFKNAYSIYPLQCVLHFHSGLRNPDIPIKVENSAQTSDPKYPENHPCLENLSLDLSKLVEGGEDSDVQLKCGDVSLKVHKLILCARSEVFRTMMQTDMVEGRQGIIEIVDMEPELLNIFIRYIYTGNLPELTMETALPIYEVADKYQVEALKKRSREFVMNNLSPENVLGILPIADAHSDSDLKDQLVHYINKEKIPSRKEEWLKFCNAYPKLAFEVLNNYYVLPKLFW